MTVQSSLWCAALVLVTEVGLRPVPAVRAAEGPETAIERGDFSSSHGQLRDALTSYQSALAQNPENIRALCGLTRVESELSEQASGEERRRLVAAAVEHGRGAVRAAPDDATGHVWLAVALRYQSRS